MAIVQKFLNFLKKRKHFSTLVNLNNLKIHRFNPITSFAFLIFFSGLFFITSNLIGKKNEEYANNFQEVTKNNEFSNLVNFFTSPFKSAISLTNLEEIIWFCGSDIRNIVSTLSF